MNRNDLKQKIKEDTLKLKTKLNVDDVELKEKISRAHAFFKKSGKSLYHQFKELPRQTKKAILIGVIALIPAAPLGSYITKKYNEHKEKSALLQKQKDIRKHLEEKYVISDQESFIKLYEDALPLIELSMFPSECLILDPYSDNGKNVSNTIGLGSFWYPANGDAKSSQWVKAAQHFKTSGHHSISAEFALDLVNGWYRHREGGRIIKKMNKLLNGAELNIHEFAAIATVMYNSEKKGEELCKFVKENYQDPIKCAQKIANLEASQKFKGIAKRHLHEAYVYLNYDNYDQKIYDFFVRTGVNSKGQFYAQTSVTQLSDEAVELGKNALGSGNIDQIVAEQNKIVSYICKGGQTVGEIIYENVLDPTYADRLSAFSTGIKESVSFEDVVDTKDAVFAAQAYKEAVQTYADALNFEKKGQKQKAQKEFGKALEGFQKIIDGGHDGPDLHNDMAITYYHMGEYQKCIQESANVLRAGEKDLYSAANYNAAKAYEAMGNYAKALENYKAGIKNGGDEKIFQSQIVRIENQNRQTISQSKGRQ